MSRSYKNTPCIRDGDSCRISRRFHMKTYANRKIRRKKNIGNYSCYRKAFDSWDIHDYVLYMSEEELKREWNNRDSWLRGRFLTYKQAYRHWYKNYKAK